MICANCCALLVQDFKFSELSDAESIGLCDTCYMKEQLAIHTSAGNYLPQWVTKYRKNLAGYKPVLATISVSENLADWEDDFELNRYAGAVCLPDGCFVSGSGSTEFTGWGPTNDWCRGWEIYIFNRNGAPITIGLIEE